MREHLMLWAPWLLGYAIVAFLCTMWTAFEARILSVEYRVSKENLLFVQSEDAVFSRKLQRYKVAIALSAGSGEELLFRAPLILLFPSMTAYAWIGIVIGTGIFALLHGWFSCGVQCHEKYEETAGTNRPLSTTERLQYMYFPFISGLVKGYLAVQFQSLILVMVLHALWDASLFLSHGRVVEIPLSRLSRLVKMLSRED